MDRRERNGSLLDAMIVFGEELQAGIQTTLPCAVVSFDPAKRTVKAQPLLRGRIQGPDGTFSWVQLPVLLDCPVIFPSGGGVVMTFPLEPGDEGLVIFGSRCIDAWWQSGGIQNQAELRMHDLSDGFFLPGPRSLPEVESDISTEWMEIRHAGNSLLARIRLNPSTQEIEVRSLNKLVVWGGNDVEVRAGTTLSIISPVINITGTLIINGVPYEDHVHTNVQNGAGVTGGLP